MNPIRKKVYDDNGLLVKENDIIKVSKSPLGLGAIKLTAKYDEKNQRWLFYTGGVVPFTLEDLKSFNIRSMLIISATK